MLRVTAFLQLRRVLFCSTMVVRDMTPPGVSDYIESIMMLAIFGTVVFSTTIYAGGGVVQE